MPKINLLYFGTIEMLAVKQSGSLIYWWKTFLDKVGHDNATLVMHTDVRDPHGQPLGRCS